MTDHAAIGRASRAKGNRYQRDSCGVLNDIWRKLNAPWECTVTGIYQRRWQDKSTPDLTVTGPCEKCNGDGVIMTFPSDNTCKDIPCPHCHGTGKRTLRGECKGSKSLPLYLWQRGPKRKPREEWWDILEGVRCGLCDYLKTAPSGPIQYDACPDCHGTGWLKHPHDFLIVKRYGAKPACEWLVLVLSDTAFSNGWAINQSCLHPIDQANHSGIAIYTAADWAAAVAKE